MINTKKSHLLILLTLTATIKPLEAKKISTHTDTKNTAPKEVYTPQSFDFKKKGVALSDAQLDQHVKLYQGYVKKRNEITHNLETVDRSNVANITYSPFRSLKIAQTFAHNGSLLHQMYFENLGQSDGPGEQTEKLLIKNFGSIENFKKDLMDSASCARGWVLTAYCLDDNTVKNFVLDAHNETVPVFVIPLLVVDTYEHAYMIDYGIQRAEYLATIWQNIDWDVVEKRVSHWLRKLK
jgi:Fe-Mn family superoxide dismutase